MSSWSSWRDDPFAAAMAYQPAGRIGPLLTRDVPAAHAEIEILLSAAGDSDQQTRQDAQRGQYDALVVLEKLRTMRSPRVAINAAANDPASCLLIGLRRVFEETALADSLRTATSLMRSLYEEHDKDRTSLTSAEQAIIRAPLPARCRPDLVKLLRKHATQSGSGATSVASFTLTDARNLVRSDFSRRLGQVLGRRLQDDPDPLHTLLRFDLHAGDWLYAQIEQWAKEPMGYPFNRTSLTTGVRRAAFP